MLTNEPYCKVLPIVHTIPVSVGRICKTHFIPYYYYYTRGNGQLSLHGKV